MSEVVGLLAVIITMMPSHPVTTELFNTKKFWLGLTKTNHGKRQRVQFFQACHFVVFGRVGISRIKIELKSFQIWVCWFPIVVNLKSKTKGSVVAFLGSLITNVKHLITKMTQVDFGCLVLTFLRHFQLICN